MACKILLTNKCLNTDLSVSNSYYLIAEKSTEHSKIQKKKSLNYSNKKFLLYTNNFLVRNFWYMLEIPWSVHI